MENIISQEIYDDYDNDPFLEKQLVNVGIIGYPKYCKWRMLDKIYKEVDSLIQGSIYLAKLYNKGIKDIEIYPIIIDDLKNDILFFHPTDSLIYNGFIEDTFTAPKTYLPSIVRAIIICYRDPNDVRDIVELCMKNGIVIFTYSLKSKQVEQCINFINLL